MRLSSHIIRKVWCCWRIFCRVTCYLQSRLSALARAVLIILIDFSRPFLGPSGCCRFSPTCTEYARQELRKGPLFSACIRIIKRLASCHSFGRFWRTHTHTDGCLCQAPPTQKETACTMLPHSDCSQPSAENNP